MLKQKDRLSAFFLWKIFIIYSCSFIHIAIQVHMLREAMCVIVMSPLLTIPNINRHNAVETVT